MADLTRAIEYLQERADRLAAQIAEREKYALATGLTPLLTASLSAEHVSLAAALEILRADELGGERTCRGNCMTCDVPVAECELPPEPAYTGETPELAAARAKVREAGDDLKWALGWQARRQHESSGTLELAAVDDARRELAAAEAALDALLSRDDDTYLPDG